jgi:hypothetical protein
MKFLTSLVILGLVGCTPDKGEDTAAIAAAGTETATSLTWPTGEPTVGTATRVTETTEETGIFATIGGNVNVVLYTYDKTGEREYIALEDAYGTEFPFGSIFVSAYTDVGNGVERYRGQTAISSPSIDGDSYEIEINMAEGDEVQVYAVLDYSNDGIIHTDDPIGVYPEVLAIVNESNFEEVDITIVAPYGWGSGTGGGGGSGVGGWRGPGGSYKGGDCSLSINGKGVVNTEIPGAVATAMVATVEGVGPIYWGTFVPQETEEDVSGQYDFAVPCGMQEMNLLGAYDTNQNNLIDPSDTWGAYVLGPETDGNPVIIEENDLNDYPIHIPVYEDETLNESAGLSVVPFTWIKGSVGVNGGSFDELTEGSTVYVAALKYRPTSDLAVSSLESNAYDYESFEWPDLTGRNSVDYELGVPAGTVVYLWAYADEDGDTIINESNEMVASAEGDDSGRLETTDASMSRSMYLGYAQ